MISNKLNSPSYKNTKNVLLEILTSSSDLLSRLAPNGFDETHYNYFFEGTFIGKYYAYFLGWRKSFPKQNISTLISFEDFQKRFLAILNLPSAFSLNILFGALTEINQEGSIFSTDKRKFLFHTQSTVRAITQWILDEYQLFEDFPEPYEFKHPLSTNNLPYDLESAYIHVFSVLKSQNLDWKYNTNRIKDSLQIWKNTLLIKTTVAKKKNI
ncbi:hypothetical protein DBR11_26235 [Pedobacter sp. HMWF019]|uniref:hypothetical protein n=1 Tax=Pedobacter sp. HMWF019 TaxID=2056856 RepID=UPI000D3C7DFD|nr:hypothetical protein [Pedobacter sp. HMWF019]PTS92836.1 hypothetical protein DBR11_26235 [Pedobacter sp. HMWF019]